MVAIVVDLAAIFLQKEMKRSATFDTSKGSLTVLTCVDIAISSSKEKKGSTFKQKRCFGFVIPRLSDSEREKFRD